MDTQSANPALATSPAPAAPAPEPSYWQETRAPLYSAAFVLPFVVAYQAGIVLLHSDYINGGDDLVRRLLGRVLKLMGISVQWMTWMSLACLIIYLVAAQVKSKSRWQLHRYALATGFFECLIWASLLFILLLKVVTPNLPESRIDVPAVDAAQTPAVAGANTPQTKSAEPARRTNRLTPRAPAAPAPSPATPKLLDFVLYCGAGVYEELVFRVFLFGLLMMCLTRLLHMEHAHAAVWSVLLSAIIFSAFHHIGGEPFSWNRFIQRVVAGLYFATLYVTRSFGVAAASHAMYDIIVGLNFTM